jgi:hypothetical protein
MPRLNLVEPPVSILAADRHRQFRLMAVEAGHHDLETHFTISKRGILIAKSISKLRNAASWFRNAFHDLAAALRDIEIDLVI